MNKIIAITGGIGSGKSTALKIIEKWGYKSFSADKTYKELLEEESFIREVSSAMGIAPIVQNGRLSLDKSEISRLAFNDKASLERLNSITHPKIMSAMLENAKACDGLAFCEVPLLFEGGFEKLFDCIFIIMRRDEKRFFDASVRDGKSVEQIKQIAKNQFDYAKITENAHTFIIYNDGDEIALAEKIRVAIDKIKA